jgi:transposase
LEEADLQPHRSRYWLTPPPDDPEAFEAKVREVCATYEQAASAHAQGIHVVSCDEKTGIQALERLHPTLPMQRGEVERREFEYVRHGTQTLIASMAVATGELVAPSVGPTRTEADFAAHVAGVVATAPNDAWIFVCDQLNTHQSEALVRLVAAREGRAEELGVKGVSGVLHTLATRAAYLSDPSHRIRFVYTPKHTSWLNQVEIWFSILARRLLKRASFVSADDLRARLLAFIDYFNRTLAKPFRWTYRGRPLRACSRTDTSAVVY